MSEIYRNLYVFVMFVSAVLSADCPFAAPCKCEGSEISCKDEFTPISSIPVDTTNSRTKWNTLRMDKQNLENLQENVFRNAGLTSLTHIVINHCDMNTIHEEAFHNVTQLFILDLSHNSLSKLSDNMFKPIENVTYLILKYNKLESINDKIFVNLAYLQELDISHNLLMSFSANALLHKKRLHKLFLNNNKLNSLNIKSVEPYLTQVRITANPWTCGCLNEDLYRYMIRKSEESGSIFKLQLNEVTCNAPDDLKGRTWREVKRKLNILPLPCYVYAITLKDQDRKKANIGGKVKLQCRIETTAIPTEMWKFNNKNIYINVSNEKYTLSNTTIDQVRYWYNLEISNLTEDDEGTYNCILKVDKTGQMDHAKITLIITDRPTGPYFYLIIVLIVFVAICLVLIFMKCAIRWHIISHTKEDQPNFQDNFKEDDDSSAHSLKIEMKCN